MRARSSMKIMAIFAVLLASCAAAAPSSLQIVPLANSRSQGVAAMSNGSVAVFGATAASCLLSGLGSCNQTKTPLLSILDASGKQTATLAMSALGRGNSTIVGAAVDSSGNIWIAGQTDSDDFPLVNALFTKKTAYAQTGFVAKLNPNLNILFSTFLGGQGTPVIANIAVDSAGNAYVVGNTNDPTFPTTGPALGTGTPGQGTNTFASKISSDGSTLVYSRLFGGSGSPCVGGSACIGYVVFTDASAIAVDTSGNLTIAGSTNTTNFPVTSNVYSSPGGAFVTRIAPDGSRLIWSTRIGTVLSTPASNVYFYSTVQSIALDATGNVYIAGSTPKPIATTSGALQPVISAPSFPVMLNGFAMELSSDATQLLFATNLGGSQGATLSGLTLDAYGGVWITGNTRSPDFPGLNNTPSTGVDFALELNANATALDQIFSFVPKTVTQPPAFDTNGNLLLLGPEGNLLRLNASTATTAPAVFAIVNSAVPRATAGVGPGELVTLYGVGLGPSTGVVGQPDENGLYPRTLGGVEVEFSSPPGSVQAPLLYAGPNQINFQAPFSLPGATITVTTPAGPLSPIQLRVIETIGVFGVLNEDGSLNSASNPARSGRIVSLYLTGLGAPSSQARNGAISQSAIDAFQNIVEVPWRFSTLPVFYAGTAPGLINGLDQINVQLPAGERNPTLTVEQSTAYNTVYSNPVLVYAQ
jgi:uncharacterized protein (TIGR03437 family)